MRVRFTVYLAESLVLSPEQSRNVPKTYPEQQITQQVKRLLNIMDGEMSRVELMQSVNLKDRVSFSKNYLEPALAPCVRISCRLSGPDRLIVAK